jgi:Stage II sporulation protein E (SpoIIE)
MKRTALALAVWPVLAVAGGGLLTWAYPRLYPFSPARWQVSQRQAVAVAQARFEDLGGPPIAKPYVVTELESDEVRERRLWLAARERGGAEGLAGTRLAAPALTWRITVFAPGARANEWTYRAEVAPTGEVTSLVRGMRPDEGEGTIDPAEAHRRADAFLVEEGFDLADFAAPEPRTSELTKRTDLTLRYRDRQALLGDAIPYGVEVSFAGPQLTGYSPWLDDPEAKGILDSIQGYVATQQIWLFLPVILGPVVGIFFLRRYHAGEVGVRRGLQIFAVALVCGVVLLLLCARTVAASWSGGISRQLLTWIGVFQLLVFYFLPLAAICFLSWTVGEVACREKAPRRLAAFDALFRGQVANGSVARASLRGLSAGLATAGFLAAGGLLLVRAGAWAPMFLAFGPWWEASPWFGVTVLALTLPAVLYKELFGRLLLVSVAARRLGPWLGGALAALAAAVIFWPPVMLVPLRVGLLLALLAAAVAVALFLRYGLLTSLLSSLATALVFDTFPFLRSGHPWLQLQAGLPLLVVALPLLLSLRKLTSEEEVAYRYDDVPPHVRRIAERERQRVELETARRIQTSILPELPPSLNGVEIAHAYLPATEVGGDFYDVLALEDGRLALAVGDVAGHGVSSGLVMSAAKSALAVQVTFNPDVEAVFKTLNRVVFQSARKRLLATLCYAVLDPVRRELLYASAGHLYPYLISVAGGVHPLEYVAYPLGVRAEIAVAARRARLAAGDTLFLLSDGLVEARPEGSEDLFGFARLEASLARHAALGVTQLRDAVLADVERHTKGAPREDDQTVLVLRVA